MYYFIADLTFINVENKDVRLSTIQASDSPDFHIQIENQLVQNATILNGGSPIDYVYNYSLISEEEYNYILFPPEEEIIAPEPQDIPIDEQ